MKTVNEIRHNNLLLLVEEFGVGDLAEKYGCHESYIRQLVNQSTDKKTGKEKGLGGRAARKFEKACNKQKGWMDTDHRSQWHPDNDDPSKKMMELWERATTAQRWRIIGRSEEVLSENVTTLKKTARRHHSAAS